jgi:hypothetical protein
MDEYLPGWPKLVMSFATEAMMKVNFNGSTNYSLDLVIGLIQSNDF